MDGVNLFLRITPSRKIDHIKIGIEEYIESNIDPGFKDVKLVHVSLPEINLNEIDTSTTFLNHHLHAPIIIEPITGGAPETKMINSNLAEAAEDFQIAIGVGSQRSALENEEMIDTYTIVRDKAPSVPVIANLGCPQLLDDNAEDLVRNAVSMLNADAIMIHLNALQEAVQPEGQTNFKGGASKISEVIKKISVPIIIKETGAGISREVAQKLQSIGVSIIDVAGLGGSSWAAVEYYRALKAQKKQKARLGKVFWDWGIPTVVSLVEVRSIDGLKLISSGGVRSGLDIAKSLALGADLAGMALPLLKPATKNVNQVRNFLNNIIEELRVAMFLTSSSTILSLKQTPFIIIGQTKEWLNQRKVM